MVSQGHVSKVDIWGLERNLSWVMIVTTYSTNALYNFVFDRIVTENDMLKNPNFGTVLTQILLHKIKQNSKLFQWTIKNLTSRIS